jgi:membrane associated rhomboid family serine protease
MSGFRRWLGTAPLAVHFVYLTVSFAVITWGLGEFLDPTARNSWWGHAVGGVVYGALMTAYLARKRRADGGVEQQWSVGTALRTGTLPDGADAEHWRPLLARKREEFRRYRILYPVLFGSSAFLGVGFALREGPRWWAAVAFFAGFAVFGVIVSERTVRRIDRMNGSLGPTEDAGV